MMDDETGRPTLHLVRGDATPEEIAALLAVISAAASGTAAEPESRPGSGWTDRARLTRQAPTPGPGAWQASGRRF